MVDFKVKKFTFKLFYGVDSKEIQDYLANEGKRGYHLASTESYTIDGEFTIILFLEREM